MTHQPEWFEVQHLIWVCFGCLCQCRVSGAIPIKGFSCEITIGQIEEGVESE